jgi:hypothetical protein
MPRALHKLIHALTIVLIRYHDSQEWCIPLIDSKNKSYDKQAYIEYATQLLSKNNFSEELTQINKNATSKYILRLGLLNFIRGEIITLKKLTTRQTSFTELELKIYSKKIIQLFSDLINLLATPKNAIYRIDIDELNGQKKITVTLNGLMDKGMGLLNSTLCRSGVFIEEEILKLFNIERTTELNKILPDITATAEEICQGHQEFILASLSHRLLEETKIIKNEYNVIIESHTKMLEQKNLELTSLKEQYEETKKNLDTAQQKLKQLQEENTLQQMTILQLGTLLQDPSQSNSTKQNSNFSINTLLPGIMIPQYTFFKSLPPPPASENTINLMAPTLTANKNDE